MTKKDLMRWFVHLTDLAIFIIFLIVALAIPIGAAIRVIYELFIMGWSAL